MEFNSNFNRKPHVTVKGREKDCVAGWEQIKIQLDGATKKINSKTKIIVVETYQGVYYESLTKHFKDIFSPVLFIDSSEILYDEETIRTITQPDVTDDRIFGYMTRLKMSDLIDEAKLNTVHQKIQNHSSTILIFGYGASILAPKADLFIYADLARWEIQLRMRAGKVNNIGINNLQDGIEKQYKRSFFVDWRICDKLKKETFPKWDFILDSNDIDMPKLVSAEAMKDGLAQAAKQPFSVVPFFDPGPWGGQWMKKQFDLDPEKENFAWCFNCIPEENSLLLKYGDHIVEIPSINVVFFHPRELLGDPVHARFGDEFPIRFDFLDTMGGGNLSLQVHPLTEYIQENFGINYTQDESYYMLDAGKDASVFLGLKEGIDQEQMAKELYFAESNETPFNAEKYIQSWPAKKHDHFLIPGGTVHCSGKNGMVLEISATPYIFTFKLYDWGRVNLDGRPRPINLKHGLKNIQWDRTTKWTQNNLINRIEKVNQSDGCLEEKTGLHEREFIETRRHWFNKMIEHHTNNGVNVFTLIEGDEVIVKSPNASFDPFIIHYAETFIVPAAVGKFTIQPHGSSKGKKCATIKAYIRVNS